MTDTITNPPTGTMTNGVTDVDPNETEEWLDALASVLEFEGGDRAHYLLDRLIVEGRHKGAPVPYSITTPYINTITPSNGRSDH
jgi:pyruvate dehydrogenase E1 component